MDIVVVLTALGTVSLTTSVAYAQRVGYPLMALVPADAFDAYRDMYMSRIGTVVAFGFIASGIGSMVLPFLDLPTPLTLASLACFTGVGVTTLGAIFAHNRLSNGFDETAHRTLLTWNHWRLVIGLLHTAVLTALVVR
jgi:tetrahydromethanopterin S-methyltransferase subunit E